MLIYIQINNKQYRYNIHVYIAIHTNFDCLQFAEKNMENVRNIHIQRKNIVGYINNQI